MIKAKKGLLLSVLSLVLALVITTSSTYAWFAMNATVSMTNMQITAVADSSFLIIQDSIDATGKMSNVNTATIAVAAQTTQDPRVNNYEVLPVTYKNTGTAQDPNWQWQTAIGTSYSDGTADPTSGYSTVSPAGYVGQFTFYVGLNPFVSKVDAENLRVTGITLGTTRVQGASQDSEFFGALSVLVRGTMSVSGNDVVKEDLYLGEGAARTTITGHGAGYELADDILSDGTPVRIDVFVFINGDHANITTQKAVAANLATFTVGVTLGCTAVQ
jgi:hypothetical protein